MQEVLRHCDRAKELLHLRDVGFVMWALISFVLVILGALGVKRLFPVIRKVTTRRRQVRFVRETLCDVSY